MKITDDMLTGWFPKYVKPVHVGFYQRDYEDVFCNAIPDYWDGKHWLIARKDGKFIARATLSLPWRGLNKEPQRD
ncbi:hypothetical protein KDW54_07080 [Burkholderia ambifaria]|uniref:hypothetical protein n=1 Tax=Burkholderia ambifaria TaxID=152480 RepID=UPI001B9EEFE6|nr:hypothetical protein [Burkholderia ambifaria]MBR8182157.1 hypothetical protein [Burkholderia ambifaria]